MAKPFPLRLYLLSAGRSGMPKVQAQQLSRPEGPLVWLHAATARTAANLHELARRLILARDDVNVVMTHVSDAAQPMDDDDEIEIIHLPLPSETGAAARQFLDHWKPDVCVWSEGDLNPPLVLDASSRGIRMIFVDGADVDLTRRGRWVPGLARSLLDCFHRILVVNDIAADRFRALGADPDRVVETGYLEEGTAALPCNEAEREELARSLGGRPVWLAASILPDEEQSIFNVHRTVIRRAHRLLLIFVPEDPDRGAALARTLGEEGWNVALRSDGEEPGRDTQVYIADTEGEMGLWYRLAPVSFLGNSLVPSGGVNPFEPAALGSAVLHGPHVLHWQDAYARLHGASAAVMVADDIELSNQLEVLQAPENAAEMAHAAWQVTSSGAEVTDRVLQLIEEALTPADAG